MKIFKKYNPILSVASLLLIIAGLFLTFTFIGCSSSNSDIVNLYQIKNTTTTPVILKFYYSGVNKSAENCPRFIILKNNESSPEFSEIASTYDANSLFIYKTDSVDVLTKDYKLLKRYYRNEMDRISNIKSIYSKNSFNKIVTNEEGETVHVFAIHKNDFESSLLADNNR